MKWSELRIHDYVLYTFLEKFYIARKCGENVCVDCSYFMDEWIDYQGPDVLPIPPNDSCSFKIVAVKRTYDECLEYFEKKYPEMLI